MKSQSYQRGLELFNRMHGGHAGEGLVNGLKDIAPELADMVIEWGFGEVMAREQLDLKTRELTIIASLITLGFAVPQLTAHIQAALNVGASKQEIVEVIMQIALYAGFPAAITAIYVAKDVFNKVNAQ